MANTIRIKRKTSASGAPSSLKSAEPAFNEVSQILYYGAGDNAGDATSIIPIGGTGAFTDLTSNQTLAGTKTFSNSPIIPTPTAGDNSTKAASTAFVTNAVTSAITSAVIYKGTVDASAANPTAAGVSGTPTNGWLYRVNVAGSVAFSMQLNVGDFVIYNGSAWSKMDATDPAVTGTSNRITVTPTGDTSYQIDIASAYAGQATITTVGTISSGTWQGSTVALSYGGTGADLSAASNGTIFKKSGSALVAATKGTDYLAADDIIDGGTY